MPARVVADRESLERRTWNGGLGNRILHVLFLVKLAEIHGYQPLLPAPSDLDEVFDFPEGVRVDREATPEVTFSEQSAFGYHPPGRLVRKVVGRIAHALRAGPPVPLVVRRSRQQYQRALDYLPAALHSSDFTVRGHFWHAGLLPSERAVARHLPVLPELRRTIERTYPDLVDGSSVAVHVRGTDFNTHLRETFREGIALDLSYYERALWQAESVLPATPLFHVFGDDPSSIEDVLRGHRYEIHRGTVSEDWAALRLSRNLIGSNSSFGWTAAAYGKDLLFLPRDGYNYRLGTGPVPYGFHLPGARIVPHGGAVGREAKTDRRTGDAA